MSDLRVDSLTSRNGSDPVNFPTGISADASGLTFDPKVTSFSPAFSGTGVALDTNIDILFDQDIQFYGSGTIRLRQGSSSGSIIQSFSITNGSGGSGLTIVGNQLTINPTSNLSYNTTYFVTLPSTGIANTSGVYYKGTTTYSFQTKTTAFEISGGTYEFIQASPTSPTGYYKYHIFTGTSSFTVSSPTPAATDLSMMMVAGGGGGGGYPSNNYGTGGGGAGGLITRTGPTWALSSGTYVMTIGSGGNGSTPTTPSNTNGGDTTLTPPTSPTSYVLRSVGGGAGGYPNNNNPPYGGAPGGSGGGMAGNGLRPFAPPANAGQGTLGQGNPGGGNAPPQPTGFFYSGGGGGGAGSVGQSASIASPTQGNAGNGGDGLAVPAFPFPEIFSPGIIPAPDFPGQALTRTNGVFAGGGGGGANTSPGGMYRGLGGSGGGGDGSGPTPDGSPPNPTAISPVPPSAAQSGADHSGGGGGGGGRFPTGYWGGNGGSGLAMIRYAVPADII